MHVFFAHFHLSGSLGLLRLICSRVISFDFFLRCFIISRLDSLHVNFEILLHLSNKFVYETSIAYFIDNLTHAGDHERVVDHSHMLFPKTVSLRLSIFEKGESLT